MTKPLHILFSAALIAACFFLPLNARAEEPAREAIIRDLAETRDAKRVQALKDALKIEPDAALVQAVMPLLNDSTSEVRHAAAAALEKFCARDAALPPLIALLRGKSKELRQAAMQALNKCGARAVKPLLDALTASCTTACADAPPEYRTALTDALGRAGPAAVPPLMDLVRARTEGPILCSAIEALGKTGAAAADATPMFVEMLVTEPPVTAPPVKRDKTLPPPPPVVPAYVKLNVAVLQALASIGPRASQALPILFELLKDGDSTVRFEAARAISKIANGSEHIPPLTETLERCDAGALANALRPFQTDGMNALLIEFDTDSATIRTRAANTFASLPVESACPFLLAALKNDAPRLRSGAALTLGEMRRMHKSRSAASTLVNSDAVLAALKDAVKDTDPDVRVLAAYACMKAIDANDADLVGFVATGLANCAPDHRARALTALDYYNLEKTGHKAAAALPALIHLAGQDIGGPASPRNLIQRIGVTTEDVPVLIEALKDKNIYSRKAVFRLLEALGPNAKDATAALVDLLGDDDRMGGKGGIDSVLAAIGPDAMPQMLEALKSLNQKKRQAITQALVKMNLDGEWLARLADMLADDRPEVRASALTVLASNSERAKFALPHVRDLLIDDDKFVSRAALELFSLLGPGTTPVLIDALKDTRPNVRARAARALKPRAGAPPPEAVKPLTELLKDDNSEVKAAALQALSACTDAAQAAVIVAGLADVMKDDNTQTRRAALAYLKLHAAAAPASAREALAPALKDTLAAVRIAAIEALQTLGPDAAPAAPLLFESIGDPERRVRAAAADALDELGLAKEPQQKMRIGEMFALDAIEQYAQAQEEFYIKTWDDNKVHYYASPLKKVPDLPAGIAAADLALEKPQPYKGYFFRLFDGQTAAAPGGEKKFMFDGKMSQGHALAAYPADYNNTGRFTFMVGDDGTIYKKDLGDQTAKLCADMRELAPDDSWAKFKVRPKDEGPVRFHPQEQERAEDMEF